MRRYPSLLVIGVAFTWVACGASDEAVHDCFTTQSALGIECASSTAARQASLEAATYLCSDVEPAAVGAEHEIWGEGDGPAIPGRPCAPGKVKVCHLPPGNPANAHTLCIGRPAVEPHLRLHGDSVGECGDSGGGLPPSGGGDAGHPGESTCDASMPGDHDGDGIPNASDCDCVSTPTPPTDGGTVTPDPEPVVDGGAANPADPTDPGDDDGEGTDGGTVNPADPGDGEGSDGGSAPAEPTGGGDADGGMPSGEQPDPDDGVIARPPGMPGVRSSDPNVPANPEEPVTPAEPEQPQTPSEQQEDPGPDGLGEGPHAEPVSEPGVGGEDPAKVGYAGWEFGCSSAGAGRSQLGSSSVLLVMVLVLLCSRRRVGRVSPTVAALAVLLVPLLAQAGPPVLLSDRPLRLQGDAAVGAADAEAPVVSTRVSELPPVAHPDSHARLHFLGGAFAETVSWQGGFEAGASIAASRNWDVGGSVVIGEHVGYRAVAEWHPTRAGSLPLLPFVQGRVIVHPVPEGVGYGLGAWGGASLELGPGRARGGLLAEGYRGPRGYWPYAFFTMVGYELDLLKPARVPEYRDRLTEIVRERKVPAPVLATLLRVRTSDIDDNPVEATVRIIQPVEQGPAQPLLEMATRPEAESAIPPGTYLAEISADGFLTVGGGFTIRAGETRVEHFRLRRIPEVPAAELTAERIQVSQKIEFEFDKATLLPSAYPLLDEVVDILLRNQDLKIRVEGHTCTLGGVDYNQVLSEKRARTVMGYLIEKGVDARRLQSAGFGSSQPLEDNSTEEGRSKNRRVQFMLITEEPLPTSSLMGPRPAAM